MTTWSSECETVAEVSQNGIVRGLNPGSARIVCTVENVSSVYDIQVLPKLLDYCLKPESLMGGEKLYLEPFRSIPFSCKAEPPDAYGAEYSIESTNPSVANVVGNELKARDTGMCQIVISSKETKFARRFTVVVQNREDSVREKKGIFRRIIDALVGGNE